jgi:hypothetical protein
MRRLLRIRNMEEEQCRLALESALGELSRLEHALTSASERERWGRRLVAAGVRGGELLDRVAGLEETHAAGRHAAALVPRIREGALDVAALREQFIGKRIERRQAETLIGETEARDAVVAGRREQQGIDDWYGSRMRPAEDEADSRPHEATAQEDECGGRRT